ncbi:hypothetical protein FDECE_9991 [Fusarium decemcellulare]|nr:hypothetical protein FDECE_9991 [Fusarium decemcellulare]
MTSSKLTCSTCSVSFETTQEQRQHAKSDSHVENIRRRVAALGMETMPAADQYRNSESHDHSETLDEKALSSDSGEDLDVKEDELPEFNQQICIFCPHRSETFDENFDHMKTSHGLSIPYLDDLAVETVALVWYLHLVIFGYHECIFCGKRRRTTEAVQQHMVRKGHCRFELSDDMLEFYDVEGLNSRKVEGFVRLDEENVRLPSGKILSHRSQTPSATKPRALNHQEKSTEQEQSALPTQGSSDALTARDRKDMAIATQLARLSVKDQHSLIHLPYSEQRALLAKRKKELNAVRREQQRMQSKTERLSNKTMMKHFTNDVPGRANG